jgi:hypothetical protein
MQVSETELHQPVEHQLHFEELLLEISAHFINLPTESIDDAIEDAQCRICKALNIDLSALWQWSKKGGRFMTTTQLTEVSGSEGLLDGIIGMRGYFMLGDNWSIPYYADIGTGGSDLTWQLFGAIGYRFSWGDIRLVVTNYGAKRK